MNPRFCEMCGTKLVYCGEGSWLCPRVDECSLAETDQEGVREPVETEGMDAWE